MKFKGWIPLAIVAALLATVAADAAGAESSLDERIAAAVAQYEKKSSASVGLSVLDLRSARPIALYKPDELRAPASNQKLLTSCVALARLGEDFCFVTAVYRIGDDVVVVGNGDPTLGDPYLASQRGGTVYDELDRWCISIRQSFDGGQRPVGNLLLCASGSPGEWRHVDWPADQAREWYVAPVAELNFGNNCIDVSLKVSGGVVTPVTSPASPFIAVLGKVSAGSAQRWSALPAADCSSVTFSGVAKSSTTEAISKAVDSPPMLLGRTLAGRMQQAGVKLAGQIRLGSPQEVDWVRAKPLAATSTPLAVAMARANKRSLNMAAECMFLAAGDRTWAGSARIASQTLTSSYGVNAASIQIRDGSGLSGRDRVSAAAMTQMLASAAARKDAAVLLASLPIAGVDGTLSERMTDGPAKGLVLGKTGWIAGVCSLSGYVLDDQGRAAMAFSILANGVRGGEASLAKAMQDGICGMLAEAAAVGRKQDAVKK
jgi:D-alanyl-D-alanine carboxypeptidase/D-alanyl-D-alanine-endopeptidase (penicillin-binding protein 4)